MSLVFFSSSGDHDMIVPHINTLNWIRNLDIALDDDWRPWSVDGQIAGLVFYSCSYI